MADSADLWENLWGGKSQICIPACTSDTLASHARGAGKCGNVDDSFTFFKSLLEASACECLLIYSNNLKNDC